jgi:hypothetical protein
MNARLFMEKKDKPSGARLKRIYGERYSYWNELALFIEDGFGKTKDEWKYYGPKSGWVGKLYLRKRNLLFFIPNKKYFTIGMVFGDKAVGAITKSDLPEEIISEIKDAKKYAEGRGFRLEIKNRKSLEILKTLLRIKILN